MSLKERIAADLKKAMLEKDILSREVLRMLKSEITNREIELGRDASDDEAIAVLQKAVKSREDVARQYEEGGRADAAAQEREEIGVVARYLPQQLSEEETRSAIGAIVAEFGLSGKKDMGRLMKELRSRHGATLDARLAAGIAAEILGG